MINFISPDSVIQDAVEQFLLNRQRDFELVTSDPRTIGLHFVVQIRGSAFGRDANDKNFEMIKVSYVHFIITAHKSVFCQISDSPDYHELNLTKFINTSNHDSCWRTDGLRMISEQYFRVRSAILLYSKDNNLCNDVGCDVTGTISPICSTGRIFRYVRVKTDYKDNRFTLNEVKWEVKTKIVVED